MAAMYVKLGNPNVKLTCGCDACQIVILFFCLEYIHLLRDLDTRCLLRVMLGVIICF